MSYTFICHSCMYITSQYIVYMRNMEFEIGLKTYKDVFKNDYNCNDSFYHKLVHYEIF
jgi:hypothetical protein